MKADVECFDQGADSPHWVSALQSAGPNRLALDVEIVVHNMTLESVYGSGFSI